METSTGVEVARGGRLSRRESLVLGAGGAAVGLTTILLPASPAAASYEGFGATLDYSTGFGVVSGFGDADGKYFSSTKVALSGLASGVTQVRITVVGAAGAATTAIANGTTRGAPGVGAVVQAVFPLSSVITSTHLHLYVGSRGAVTAGGTLGSSGMPYVGAAYAGGSGTGTASGGGGGAGSVVFLGNGSSNSTVIAVAGGGGGGGGGTETGVSSTPTSSPGGAGGDGGRKGIAGSSVNGSALGGGGGTLVAAGAGGSGPAPGLAGSTTSGGQAGNAANGGGGGGGGLFGGGGGAGGGWNTAGGGGGGGSSFLLSVADGATDHYYGANSTAEAGWIKLEFK